jgi:hypothetical protein
MSESSDAPIVNDAITSDDAGFSSDVGNQVFEESQPIEEAVEASEESSEEVIEASGEEGVQAESVQELKEEIEEAVEEGATEEEVRQMIKEYNIKVNGKEKTVKLDLSNEQDIIRKLQLAEASQVAMQEKRELEKSYEEELRELTSDPFKYLEKLGLDPLKLSEERIKNEIQERQKSPELREKERIERELAEARAELKKQQEEAENARMSEMEAKAAAELDQEISDALDAHPSLPRTEGTIARIADTMMWAYENSDDLGIDPSKLRVEDVIPTVEQEIRGEIRALLNQLPEDGIEELLGQQTLERMRKKRLNSVKTASVNDIKPTTSSVKKAEKPKSAKRQRAKDYFKNL